MKSNKEPNVSTQNEGVQQQDTTAEVELWEENVEVVSLNADEDREAETSFTYEVKSQEKLKKLPVPPPRRKSSQNNETSNRDKTPTNDPDTSQRLAPPQDKAFRGSTDSRRQSIGGWSVGSMNSQSDSRSYRERLRERIQTVKEQAGSSITTAKSRLKQHLKIRSSYLDLLGREENEVAAAIEKHEEIRKKWTHVAHATMEAEAAYNFFTKEWEPEESGEEVLIKSTVDENNDGEEVRLVTKDFLGLPDEWQDVGCFVEAAPSDLSLRVHQENQLYYYPSDHRVKLEDKLGPDVQPRYIEEEGLYVGTKPVWSRKSYNKLQQRLLKEGRRHWFGEDGELKTNLNSDPSVQTSDPLLMPVYKNAEIMKTSEPAIKTETQPRQSHLLELEVANVSWTHHPLCSREHVAARRVLSLFQDYSGRVQAGLGRRLAHKLQALRKARDTAKRNEDQDRYIRYKSQVRETRELRLEEGRKDRAAVVNCLKAWLELRTLRTEQGYSVTPVRLNIIEMDCEKTNMLFGIANEWATELKCQVSERLEEEDEKYKNMLEEQEDTQEEKGGDLMEVSKPYRSEILEEVKYKLSESLTPPGEPVIALELADDQTTPEAEITNTRELERRAAQRRCLLSVRVLCNKHVVCQSRSLPIYPHFTTAFNERFSLQVTDWPQSLSLELVTEGGVGQGKSLNALVYIPVPSRNTTLAVVPLDHLEFNTPSKLGPYTHAGVGCGLPGTLYAGGQVSFRVGWGDQGGPIHKPYNTRTPRKLLTNLGSMREWLARAHLDPNDPSNADLFESIKGESGTNDLSSDSKDKLLDGDFCTMEDIENNPRLKLLNLRSQMVPEFREIRNIPLKDREIPDDIFKLYEKRIQCRVRSGPEVGETAVEWQREWSRQQLDLIRDNIVQHCRQTQQQCSLREVVLEDQVPDIGTLGLTFMKWLQPKRPLRPIRKERKKFPVMGLVGQEVEVIVNVVRAFEVPVRVDIDPLLDNDLSLVPVRPFVEVSFQNRKSRTTTAGGANPTWNQDLRIPVKLPSTGLHQVQDKLYCQLYDETVVDLLEDDRQRETNIHQRLQRQWLGSLQIPFTTLYTNSRIEGTFQLYSPPVLLGYERESQQRQSSSSHSSGLRDSTFLTLFITVHPSVHPPQPFKERLPCSEMPFLEQHLEEWQSQYASQFPHRPLKCLVVDTSAKSVCVTRFFRPLAPPVLEEDEPTTPEMAVRFVSKIPVVPGNMLFPGLFDIWLTAQQVLSLLSGDAEDHAVLLCCYLMHLGMKAWLLLGSGVPHGPMALVLTRDLSGSCTLWDPITGQQFHIQDSFCPLQRVYCLINQDNIWANIQREDVVSRTRFDVTKRGDWWPAFNRNVAAPMESVQPAELEYVVSATLKTDVDLLQDKLEKILRDSITKWRPTTRTIWNRYVTVKLRKLLPGLEKMACSNVLSSSEHVTQLSQLLSSHKMSGFTQNFAFTSTEEIVEAVKATGIHTSEDSDVEFALAVYVHPFVCGVLSVWIYVTSLIVRR